MVSSTVLAGLDCSLFEASGLVDQLGGITSASRISVPHSLFISGSRFDSLV